MFKHILTATDGSDWADKGVQAAIGLAAALGAKLTILTASDPYPDYLMAEDYMVPADIERIRGASDAQAQVVLATAAAAAEAQGVKAHTVHVPMGPASLAMTEQAQKLGVDVIVIGSRGRRGLTKLFLGSQAAEVLAGTQLPVMIVK